MDLLRDAATGENYFSFSSTNLMPQRGEVFSSPTAD